MFRQIENAVRTEVSSTQTVVLAAAAGSSNGVPTIFPKQTAGRSIAWLRLLITATITQSAAANYTVGSLIKELTIKKGSKKYIDITSEDQLEKLWHMLTGLAIGASYNANANTLFSNPTNAGAAGQTTQAEEIYIPLWFNTQVVPLITLTLYGYGAITNATAGSVSFAVEFGYVDRQLSDDVIEIVTVPSALNAGSDLDLQDQFSEAAPIDEVWVELTNDSDLNYFTFEVGSDQVFEQMPPTTVQIREEQGQMLFSHIGGFYRAPTPRGVVYKTPAGVNTANKLIINLATSRSPTLYLWLSPAPVSVSAASGVVQVAQH
jgi:hypothetical protein